MSLATMSFILGGLLVAVAVLGGGFEVKELKIPQVARTSRVLCFIVGAVFVGLAISLNFSGSVTVGSQKESTTSVPSVVKADSSAPATDQKAGWLTSSEYQNVFNERVKRGYYPHQIQGKCVNGGEQFRAEWQVIPFGAAFYSFHVMTKDDYERKSQEFTSTGYSLDFFDKFRDCSGVDLYQATWLKK